MNLRIAVTRAEPEASRTASRLDAAGAEAVLAPLIEIAPRAFERDLTGIGALIFTSANGVRAFGDARGAVPVFAVGAATAAAARDAGFRDIVAGDADSAALVALIAAQFDRRAGALIHVSGADIAGDIVGDLKRAGFDAERRIAYEARAVDEAPLALARRLATAPPALDAIAFHSARAVAIFTNLSNASAPALTAVCLSAPIGEAARAAGFGAVSVAESPHDDALIRVALAL